MAMRWLVVFLAIGTYGLAAAQPAATAPPGTSASNGAAPSPLPWPHSPEQWINCPPLSLEQLHGKGVVLWVFEEQCPSCAERWPDLQEFAASKAEVPVLFVGLNSGCSRDEIAAYAKKNDIKWPIVLDPDRSIEKVLGVEISLQNVYQAFYITPKGELRQGNHSDLEAAVTKASLDAKWQIPPAEIPADLLTPWRMVEFGLFAPAARPLTAAAKSTDSALREPAGQVLSIVNKSMQQELADIGDLMHENHDWAAYRQLLAFRDRYAGYEQHPAVATKIKELATSDGVKAEVQAQRQLAVAMRAGASGSPAGIKRATGILQKLVESAPETEAATQAKKVLAQVEAAGDAGRPRE